MKYRLETFGQTCHYQIANVSDDETDFIHCTHLTHSEIEETFLSNKSLIENRKLFRSDNIEFKIFNEKEELSLEFSLNDINENRMGSVFCPEPKFSQPFEFINTLCYFDVWRGGGPIFEFETNSKITVDSFSFTTFLVEGRHKELCFVNDVLFCNNKIPESDFGGNFGESSWVEIYMKNGDVSVL